MRVKKYLALIFAAILATTMLTACPWEKEEVETDDASSVPVTSTDTSQDDDSSDSGNEDEEEEEKDPTPPEVTISDNSEQSGGTVSNEKPTYNKDTKTFSVTFTTEPTNNTHIASKVNVTGHTKDGGTFSGSWSADRRTAAFARASTEATVTIKPDTDQKVFTVTGIPADATSCTIDVTFADLGYVIEGGTYKVHNADGLLVWNAAVQGNMSLNCTLIDNIDLGEENWTPIGNSYSNSNAYAGTFDGGGYTISGLKVSGGDYVGLFGYVKGGTVKNLNLEITSVSGNDYVGSVVGCNEGTILGCMVSGGSVTASDENAYVGGVVGRNYNTVEGCCFAGGSVTGTRSGAFVGGVVGQNAGTIKSCCFVSGSVSGNGDVGGVVGCNYYGTITGCCFAGDSLSGSSAVGGVVGASNGDITNCYWQTDRNGNLSKGVGDSNDYFPDLTTPVDNWNDIKDGAFTSRFTVDSTTHKPVPSAIANKNNTPEVSGLTQRVLDTARVFWP